MGNIIAIFRTLYYSYSTRVQKPDDVIDVSSVLMLSFLDGRVNAS
jgi:hypothetical protein